MSTLSSFLTRSSGVLALALVSAACGSSPSSLMAPSAPLAAGATIQGVINGGGASTASAHTSASTSAGLRVSVVGQPLSATTDAQGRFTLAGLPSGSVTLRIEGTGIDALLKLGGLVEGQVLSIEIEVHGSQAEVVTGSRGPSPSPTPTPSPTPSPRPNEDDVQFRGAIESITPPSLQVAGRFVTTDANTRVLRGDTVIALADLRVGETVEVEGSSIDAGVLASKIKVEDEDGEGEVEFRGAIDSISPPSLVVDGRRVDTDGSTRIRRGDTTIALTDLRVGETVEVEGHTAGTAVLASKIKVEDESGDDGGNSGGGSGDDGGGDDGGGGSGSGSGDDGGSHGGGSGSGGGN